MDELNSPQVDAGLPADTGSQDSGQTEQSAGQNQNSNGSQVESADQGKQVTEETRKPSEWFAGRKLSRIERQIQNLTTQLQQAQQTWQQPQSGSSASGPKQKYVPTADEVWKDPAAVFQRMLDERMESVRQEIPKTVEQRETEFRWNQSRQDALKLIKTNEAVKRDPEGEEKIKDILEDETYNLDKIAQQYPMEAARMALEIYNLRYGGVKKNPAAPTKAQMVSTATTVTTGGAKVNLNEEALKLQQEAMANPMLLRDPAWIEKVQAIKNRRVADLNAPAA